MGRVCERLVFPRFLDAVGLKLRMDPWRTAGRPGSLVDGSDPLGELGVAGCLSAGRSGLSGVVADGGDVQRLTAHRHAVAGSMHRGKTS